MKNDFIIDSLRISVILNKSHKHVLHKIDMLLNTNNNIDDFFFLTSYKDVRGRNQRKYMITKDGISFINQWYKNPQLAELCGQKVLLNASRFEVSFSNILLPILDKMGIEVIRQKKVLNYKIDFYIPEFNLAVEYDEEQHRFSVESDAKRMDDIRKEIDCKFIRLSYKDTDAENVGIVLKEIYSRIKNADIK